MIRDIVTQDMTLDDWKQIRERTQARVLASMGEFPDFSFDGSYDVLKEEVLHGVNATKICFEAVPGVKTYGRFLISPEFTGKRPGALCMHGSDRELAHLNQMLPDKKPNRQYALELAKRGYLTLATDLFAFGEDIDGKQQEDVEEAFYERFPNWSLDGIRLWINRCALDVFQRHERLEHGPIGAIGNSKGGRVVAYLAAFDQRIGAAVPSCGVSPNLTNLFSNYPNERSSSLPLSKGFVETGLPGFEYQDLLALIAPRGLLMIEPWNDPYNPLIEPDFRIFEKIRLVYDLYSRPEAVQILCHGDGHDTVPRVREYAYRFIHEMISGAQ